MTDSERDYFRDETQRLCVLVANERPQRLETVTQIVESLGHEVTVRSVEVTQVGELTRREQPDVALVGLGESSEHALELIGQIVHQAACPVIALLETKDTAWVNEAAKRGIFAYITDTDRDQLQSALDIVLRRFAEYHGLEGAFGRRAMIERAKGILMATHAIDERDAFARLRSHSQNNGRKVIDVAEAVVDSHRLLLAAPEPQAVAGNGRQGQATLRPLG